MTRSEPLNWLSHAAILAAVTATALAIGGQEVRKSPGQPHNRTHCCPVLELRQYTLHPGARDTLVDLFDRHFVESQEEYGVRVVGQFRDVDNADRFVWLRGFEEMESRARALEAFYSGPVWKRHANAANATMINSDNVLLLRPADGDAGFRFTPWLRAAVGDPETTGGIVVATIHYFTRPVQPTFLSWFGAEVVPALAQAGTSVLARFVTEPSPNTFARLPVREGENVFIWFAAYPDQQNYLASMQKLEDLPDWKARIVHRLRALTKGEPERLVLAPTQRSVLRYDPR